MIAHVILSPHLDDAVLSLGQTMQSFDWPELDGDVRIVTAFAGIPDDGVTAYDASKGFDSSAKAMAARRVEDTDAFEVLQRDRPNRLSTVHLDLLDFQYHSAVEVEEVADAIRPYFSDTWHTFAPLGLGHPDHRMLREAAMMAAGPEILFYEEMPYRVLNPEEVVPALQRIERLSWTFDRLIMPWEQGDLLRKIEAISCYRSQYPDGPDHSVLVPERVWRAWR